MKNCQEIEQDVYLYDELTPAEKEIIDAHMATCGSCQELFSVVQEHHAAIQKVAQHKPQLENFSRLTSNIMQAIGEKETQSTFSKIFDRLFTRYAFVAASLALIMLFTFEQIQATTQVQRSAVQLQSKTVTLRTADVLKNIRKKKEENKPEVSLYACVKSGDCNYLSKTLN